MPMASIFKRCRSDSKMHFSNKGLTNLFVTSCTTFKHNPKMHHKAGYVLGIGFSVIDTVQTLISLDLSAEQTLMRHTRFQNKQRWLRPSFIYSLYFFTIKGYLCGTK